MSGKMELAGKIVGLELKDVAKGKDAESHEVGMLQVKLGSVEGLQGRCSIPVPMEEMPGYALGDVVSVDVNIKQQKLALQK